MSKQLKERVSKYFDYYLMDFKKNGAARRFPNDQLSQQEWQDLNEYLSEQGVCLVPFEFEGKKYMQFADLPQEEIFPIELFDDEIIEVIPIPEDYRDDLSVKLGKYTNLAWDYKAAQNSGLGYEHYRINIDAMSPHQVSAILDNLGANGIRNVKTLDTNKGRFLIVRADDYVLDSVLGDYNTINYEGVPVHIYYQKGMGKGGADKRANQVMEHGYHYANVLSIEGNRFSDYIVIAMSITDAEKSGYKYNDSIGALESKVDRDDILERIRKNVGKPLTYIGKTPAVITSEKDFGSNSGRPIVLVTVGDKKIPFYISTGTAGKTNIETGKWEFFCGINEKGWFRKGDAEMIQHHYYSPELKQIAAALDAHVGDLRDTKDVLKSAGRRYLGGIGFVAKLHDAPYISEEHINVGIDVDEDKPWMIFLSELKAYLQNRGAEKSLSDNFKQGANKLRSRVLGIVKGGKGSNE